MIDFLQYLLNGILIGLLYAIIALAFIVIYRAGRILNLAQGEVVVFGGFVVWTFIAGASFPLWIALPLSLIAVVVLGFMVEKGFFRPMIGQSIFANIMITVGLMVLMRGLMIVFWGASARPFPVIFSLKPIIFGPFSFTRSIFIGAIISLAVFIVMNWIFEKTRWGLGLSTVAENHVVAQSMGISVKRSIGIAWALGFIVSTLAAITFLSGQSINFLVSEIGLRALPVVLLGGLESIWGAPLAGILIGVGEALAAAYLDKYTMGAASEAFPFIIMLVILLIRPQGIFGWKIIERV
ncbi:MAG: branched-chain amino acid ABC transporter permease [Deltaproteobacteria bacterium]|nr:branched-chain amino acid ABC transporter permease [Deltaproteobacteria bacterium]